MIEGITDCLIVYLQTRHMVAAPIWTFNDSREHRYTRLLSACQVPVKQRSDLSKF